ncbi:MAG: hypothetical protein ABSD03_14255 [Vulcanimicrobiaceae bacterium]|jgi:hypothetical protein
MGEIYDATYAAVSNRIGNVDLGAAVRDALHNAGGAIEWQAPIVAGEFNAVAYELRRPSTIYRPELFLTADGWCARYGAGPDGAFGCGASPAEAMADFDRSWHAKLPAGVETVAGVAS